MVRVMLPIWLVSWAVLLPINSVKTSVSPFSSGLYKFTFGNINATHNKDRYMALLVLTWILTSKFQAWHPYSSFDISCLNSMDLVEYKT
jgi:hypothetical protein